MDSQLKKSLGPVMLWGLGVGYVISGMYFGWNLGLPDGGPYGLLAAMLLVTVLYIAFVLGYSELACALPRAGGAFVYAHRALGPALGFVAGLAQLIEFVFAPPAIAAAIGAYFQTFFPHVSAMTFAIGAYVLFTGLNIYGVKQSAVFELVVTILAVAELLIFGAVAGSSFSFAAFTHNPLPKGPVGILAAIPSAVWFYLAIEGLANVAEEARDPQRDLARGFGWSMATLVVLALLTFFAAVGVAGWEAVVFPTGQTTPSDSPLPLALSHVVGQGHVLFHMLVGIGLCGLVASFHGIILVAGRATFEFGRTGYLPRLFGTTLPGRKTPAAALLLNMLVGILALATGKTGEIITIAVFGALTMYALAMVALLRLRQREPELVRPFRVPLYPWTPLVALGLSLLCLAGMAYYNPGLTLVYAVLVGAGLIWYVAAVPKRVKNAASLDQGAA